MPNLKVWGLPTNEKEELIKMLPHLKNSFERKKGCTMPTKKNLKAISFECMRLITSNVMSEH